MLSNLQNDVPSVRLAVNEMTVTTLACCLFEFVIQAVIETTDDVTLSGHPTEV